MAYKIPTYESQVNLVTPPAQMPFASPESGGILGRATEVAAQSDLQDSRSFAKLGPAIAELALMHKQASDSNMTFKAITDTAVKLTQEAQTAPDFDSYYKTAQDLVAKTRDSLPSSDAQRLFDRHMEGFLTRISLDAQHHFYKEGVQLQATGVLDSLDKLVKGVNDAPSFETAHSLVAQGHTQIEAAMDSKIFTPGVARKLQQTFEQKIWLSTAERRAQDDPVGALEELKAGNYDAVLDPHHITGLIDKATQRINVDVRVQKMQDREIEREGRLQKQQVFNSFVGRFLDSDADKSNPMELLASAEASGMDEALFNRFHKMVLDRVNHQVNIYRGLVLKTLNLPADLPALIAKKEGMGGVNMQAYNEYLQTMDALKGYVMKGMPVDIAGGIVQQDLKQRLLKSPLASLIGLDDAQYPPPAGFNGNKDNPQELIQYGQILHDRSSQGLITPAQEILGQKQIFTRINFLHKRSNPFDPNLTLRDKWREFEKTPPPPIDFVP